MFVIYLFNNFNCSSFITSNYRRTVNNEREEMWKESVVLKSEILSWRFPKGLKKTTKIYYNKPVCFVWFDSVELCCTYQNVLPAEC
jgi:hypothetical protein